MASSGFEGSDIYKIVQCAQQEHSAEHIEQQMASWPSVIQQICGTKQF
jgi:hypothetical protein